jgi:uncharacterized protein YeaO (DUF488 family)
VTKARGVRVRRIYDPPTKDEGYRALVDRLWPRGVKSSPGLFDEWAKDAAPSPELRRWYGHDPAKFSEFAKRYRAELVCSPAREVVERLSEISTHGTLTLLTATKDVDHSGAKVLAELIGRSGGLSRVSTVVW